MKPAALLLFAASLFAQSPQLWDATVNVNGLLVPFQMEIDGPRGAFHNGAERYESTQGFNDGQRLDLEFAYFGARLTATWQDGQWQGQYIRGKRTYPFTAAPAKPISTTAAAPAISGVWEIEAESPKGEKAWRLVVEQEGAVARASILRIDGDTGELRGSWQNGQFLLSHFSGMRPAVLRIKPAPNNTLELNLNEKNQYIARRPEAARAAGLTAPLEAQKFTTMKNPNEPLRFSAPDLNGKLVTESDTRFQGKVVLVNIMGSWCPNCHDEVPFLVELYQRFRHQGLEIVALDFEEAEELENPERLKAFLKRHGVEYTVLLAGETSTAREKLQQTENWNSWPTTFFVGRDGLVKGAHAGFPGKASGVLYDQARREFTAMVEKLLTEREVSSREN
jgi:thiol-disulfide isomerase/thioredoxin